MIIIDFYCIQFLLSISSTNCNRQFRGVIDEVEVVVTFDIAHVIFYIATLIEKIDDFISNTVERIFQISCFSTIIRFRYFIVSNTSLLTNPVTEVFTIFVYNVISIFIGSKCNHFYVVFTKNFIL